MDVPAPPPVEWPSRDQALTLRQEFQSLREGLLGSNDFPKSGAINDLRREIAAADQARRDDVARLHERLGALGEEIVGRINGTYVKTADFNTKVDGRIQAARDARKLHLLASTPAKLWSLAGFLVLVAGVIVAIVTRTH